MIKKLTITKIAYIFVYAILVIIPILPVEYVFNFPIQYRITIIIYAITLIGLLYVVVQKKIKLTGYNLKLIDIVAIVYISIILLSSLFSKYPIIYTLFGISGRAEGFFTILGYFFCFYIANKFFRIDDTLFKGLAIVSITLGVIAIIQGVFQGKIPAHSNLGNGNFYSSYICMILPIFIILYLNKSCKLYLIACMFNFAGLVCSTTTSGYATFIIYFIAISIWAIITKTSRKQLLFLFLVFCIIYLVLNLCTSNAYLNEILNGIVSETINAYNDNENILSLGNNRLYIYSMVSKIIMRNPLLGVGPDCLALEINQLYRYTDEYTYYFGNLYTDKAHSEYLHIAVTTGIPSLIIYIIFVLTIAITMIKKYSKDRTNYILFAFGISIASYLIQATVNISVVQVAPIFWIILGIGYQLATTDRNVEI